MLTDAQWTMLEPLVEQCRPKGKTPPHDLRRTMEAILWRHQNGAKWRSIPAELGPWWRAAQTFIRWARLKVWENLLGLAQLRGVALGMAFIDGTTVRAHHKAAGATKGRLDGRERDEREALGRSRGGYGTKILWAGEWRRAECSRSPALGRRQGLRSYPLLISPPCMSTSLQSSCLWSC